MKKSVYTTIYRLEHPEDKRGPYRSSFQSSEWEGIVYEHSIYSGDGKHPHPHDDGIPKSVPLYSENICGCANFSQLREWFGKSLPLLLHDGFNVVKYYLPKKSVYYGAHQVVFNPSLSPIRKKIL